MLCPVLFLVFVLVVPDGRHRLLVFFFLAVFASQVAFGKIHAEANIVLVPAHFVEVLVAFFPLRILFFLVEFLCPGFASFTPLALDRHLRRRGWGRIRLQKARISSGVVRFPSMS